jgi:Flp pilus assembly protein CpaB
VKPVQVVFSKDDVPAGTQLREEILEPKDWPKGYLTSQLTAWSEVEKLVGKVASQRIPAGNPVFLDAVQTKPLAPPTAALERGYRAFTISTDLITGVAGMIKVGSRVDVLAHVRDLEPSGGGRRAPAVQAGGTSTVTLLENIKVLGVGAYSGRHWGPRGREESDASSVTVSVTPIQAGILAYGQKQGSLTLVLRGEGDLEQVQPPVVDGRTLLQMMQQARPGGGPGR